MAILNQIYAEAILPMINSFWAALPGMLSGLVFLVLAYPIIRIVLWGVRKGLTTSRRKDLIVDLGVLIVSVFLWFGVSLVFLSMVGLEDIAASLGTATGFIGLGIAFALKGMIADTVAGVYLLKDQDFNVGDRVKTGDVEGEVRDIDLRKTRIELDNENMVVLANQEVEKKWTKLSSDGEPATKEGSE